MERDQPSDYPLAILVADLLRQSGNTAPQFAKKLGYRNVTEGAASITECLSTGTASATLLDRLRRWPTIDCEALETAIEKTLTILEREGLDECEEQERLERASFRPHLLPMVEDERPTARQLANLWTDPVKPSAIYLSPSFPVQPHTEQLLEIREAIKKHRAVFGLRTKWPYCLLSVLPRLRL